MHEFALTSTCSKVGRFEMGSICILNLYRNITHNSLIKRGLAGKNCRELGLLSRFLKVSQLRKQGNNDL
jgi:hypothetical protein